MNQGEEGPKAPETRPRGVDRRQFLRYAAFSAGGLVLAGCAKTAGVTPSEGMAAGGGPAQGVFDPATALAGLVMVYSNRPGRQTQVLDLGRGRILATVNWAENKFKVKPHHFTPVQTDNPFAGFIGLQTGRSTSETFICAYEPTDAANPVLGGEFVIKANLTDQYGVKTNHHNILKPDKSMWVVGDDQHDVVTFVPTGEPYAPIKMLAFRAEKNDDKKVTKAWVEELKPGADGKYDVPTPEEKFGALRQDSACWTADGRWCIANSRSIGVNWVIDGETLEIVHAFPTAEGGSLMFVEEGNPAKGVMPMDKTTSTHGVGVTNDSRFFLVNDLDGNSVLVYDIADPDPRNWKEAARIPFPGEGVGVMPYHENFTPDGKYALIACRSYDAYKPGHGATVVVDTSTWEIVKVCEMEGFVEPHGIAVTPDGKYFIQAYSGWDTTGGGHVVWSMDTLEPVHRMPTGVAAHEAVIVQMSKMTNGC